MFSWRLIAIVFSGLLLAAPTAYGQAPQSDEAGKSLFMHYCSSCHGESGKGDGKIAEILELKPADLTQLAKRNGGELSFLGLLQSIDGRQRVRGHGETGMPVWGEVLSPQKGASTGEQLQVAGKLLLITYYVESLQEK